MPHYEKGRSFVLCLIMRKVGPFAMTKMRLFARYLIRLCLPPRVFFLTRAWFPFPGVLVMGKLRPYTRCLMKR